MKRLLLLAFASSLVSCGAKTPVETGPIVGWHKKEAWKGSCFHPKAWEQMGIGDRRVARQQALDAMFTQWSGDRGDGVSFSSSVVTELETVLLGRPERIEEISLQNLEFCEQSMASTDTTGWGNWLGGLSAILTEGECKTPFDYTMYDYLDIGKEWHIPLSLCREDTVRIKASSKDFYRVRDNGPWINVDGDPDETTSGTDYPCNIEGCKRGQLLMRFTGESGIETILPVGVGRDFTPTEDGRVDLMINDKEWYDNKYKIQSGIEHHTSIEYSPVD